MSRDEVLSASEIWLSSSTKELAPVVSLDGKPVNEGCRGRAGQQHKNCFSDTASVVPDVTHNNGSHRSRHRREHSHLRGSLAAQRFMAVVKADAFGHGAVRVAQHIQHSVDALAVAFTEEAVALRERGLTPPTDSGGPHTASDLALAGKLNLWPVIHSDEQLEWCKTLGQICLRRGSN